MTDTQLLVIYVMIMCNDESIWYSRRRIRLPLNVFHFFDWNSGFGLIYIKYIAWNGNTDVADVDN